MGNIPTLEEVKEYFKNADKVQDNKKDKGFVELEKIEYSAGSFIQNPFEDNWVVLYHDKKGYAKILTYKELTYIITKEQVLELADLGYENKLKKWFPEVFETKLEASKWYKMYFEDDINKTELRAIVYVNKIVDQEVWFDYGIKEGEWIKKDWIHLDHIFIEATEQEVKTALENEAVKRGFKDGVYIEQSGINKIFSHLNKPINGKFYLDKRNFTLDSDNGFGYIFQNGKWATIIPTITKKEAEEKLNCKII